MIEPYFSPEPRDFGGARLRLSELLILIGGIINTQPAFSGVWVVAETVDVRVTGGHCYMELVEKNESSGGFIAKARATIWASIYNKLAFKFFDATGSRFTAGIKLLLRVNVTFHPVYGLSLNITDIDPQYTLGDIEQRRREILQRLSNEGVIDMNKEIPWPSPLQRIAVISAPGAAGLGDFLKHIALNPRRLRFSVELFPAIMQGDKCATSIIDALNLIATQVDNFDCVVIIRGGGATSDLVAFDSYDLAMNVAQFPLPVIAGVGHDRDVTVIDHVAKMHVKTPTAAADWLINNSAEQLDSLRQLAADILQAATDRISGTQRQLTYYEAALPARANAVLQLASSRLSRASVELGAHSGQRIQLMMQHLDSVAATLQISAANVLHRASQRVDSVEALVNALSPQATLRRGYTITRRADTGKAVTDSSQLASGDKIVTTFAKGNITSEIK